MKNSTRKVVILDNVSSPYIHQAIIVLNDLSAGNESKAVSDAEKIVNEYLKRHANEEDDIKIYSKSSGVRRKKKKFSFLKLMLSAIIAAVVCAAVLKLL